MEKEKILEAARKDEERGKEFEHKEFVRSIKLSYIVSLAVGAVLSVIESFIKGTANFAVWAVLFAALGTRIIYEGVRFKRVWKLMRGVFLSAMAVVFAILYVAHEVFV